MEIELSQFDREVRAACQRGDFQEAATRCLEAYGPEVLSFLRASLRSASDGDEVFSMLAEDLWKGLPTFAFRCSVRGWLYVLSRNAARRYQRSPHNRRERHESLEGDGWLAGLAERGRTTTKLHKRTEVKHRMRALRARLAPEDQALLILHVDRGLSWRDLAHVMHEGTPNELLSGAALEREAARLRKRFERVKARLRELAITEGLLTDS